MKKTGKRSMKKTWSRGKSSGIAWSVLVKAGVGKKTDADVARAVGLTRARVHQLRKAHNIKINTAARAAAWQKSGKAAHVALAKKRAVGYEKLVPKVMALANKGKNTSQIAHALGLSWYRVRAVARFGKIKLPRGAGGRRASGQVGSRRARGQKKT